MTLLTTLPRPLPVLDIPVRFDDEQRLLALALTYPDVAAVVLDSNVLRPTDFYHDCHSRIYTALRALHTQGQALNLATVPLELRRRGWEDEARYVFDTLSSAIHLSYGSEDVAAWITALQQRRRAGELQDLQRDAISAVESGDPAKMQAAYAALLEGVSDTPKTPTGYTLYSYSSLATLPPARWLVQDEIPENGLSMLVGPSEGGKSFVMVDRALRVALAHPDEAVIYLAPEGGTGYRKRVQAWCQHHGVTPPENLYFILDTVSLLDKGKRDRLLASLGTIKPVLIVVDTLARSMIGGDENSTKDMGLMIDACDQLRHATGAAVQLVHHTGKNGSGYRGSSALFGACDVVVELANDDGLITLSCGKSKDSAHFEPYCLRMVAVGESCALLPAERVLVNTKTLTSGQRKILETLNLAVFVDCGAKHSQICEVAQLPSATTYRALSALKVRGLIRQGAKGDPYHITEEGQAALTPDSHNSHESQNQSPSESPSESPIRVERSAVASHQDTELSLPLPQCDAQLSQLSHDSHQLSERSSPTLSHSHHPVRGERVRVESEMDDRWDDDELPDYDPIAACDAALDRRSWIDARPHLDEVAEGPERERLQQRYQAVKASWGKRVDAPLFE